MFFKSPKFFTKVLLTTLLTACGSAQLAPVPPVQGPFVAPQQISTLNNHLAAGPYTNFKISPRLPKADGPRKAVKLTYLMTDDTKHQSPWSEKMLAMLDDLPQRNVHNVVFRDGVANGDSKMYYIQQGDNDLNTIRNPQSHLAPGVGEVQSNNPMVFSEVMKWTLDQYPAQYKYLQIYTHGGGFFGIGTDHNQTAPNGAPLSKQDQKSMLSPAELNGSLKRALRGRKIDVLYFRACLMGNIEALYELRDTVSYALASEDVSYSVPNSNITMTQLFDELASKGVAPREVARQMSIAGKAKNSGWRNGYTTLAAIDIQRLTELKSALNTMTKTLIAAMPTYRAQILAAYDSVPWMNDSAQSYYIRDLWAFTSALLHHVPDRNIQAVVQRVRQAQEAATIHGKDIFGGAANGLSIMMPKSADLPKITGYLKGPYQSNRFARDSGWDEFLVSLAGAQ